LDEEEVLRFAQRIVEGSYPGEWGDSSDANVESLAESVLEYHSRGGDTRS
jgi:hypothetical protein